MGKYVTVDECNTYLGLSCEDSTMSALIDSAEAMVDNYTGVDLEENTDWTEEVQFPANMWNIGAKYAKEIIVSGPNPHGTIIIDGTTIAPTDYRIYGQRLSLKDAIDYNTTWPHTNTIEFTSGYATIPNDVKSACYMIVGALNSTKGAQGIDKFKQDMLEVTYSGKNIISDILDPEKYGAVALLLNKYKQIGILASGIDRSTIPGIY